MIKYIYVYVLCMARVYPFLFSYSFSYTNSSFYKFLERKNLLLFFYLNYYIFNYI